MGIDEKIEHMIIDTSAFIENVQLQEFGHNIITEQSVINEITNKRQLRRLVVLPYDLIIKDVFPENIKFVTEFSQKTGDYRSLSATDIKVIALTYQLEKEIVGQDHLKDEPPVVKTLPSTKSEPLAHPKSIAGFYYGDDTDDDDDREKSEINNDRQIKIERSASSESEINSTDDEDDISDNYSTAHSDSEQLKQTDLNAKFEKLNCIADDLKLEGGDQLNVDDILAPSQTKLQNDDDNIDTEEDSDDESDDGGWITPSNIVQVKKRNECDISEKPVRVACMTTDFAMQNVLKQIGLNVAALDGRVINQIRTFIFRCHACFTTTSDMKKLFCPRCGLKTLKKVAVSVDNQGNQQIHINFRKPLSARGKRFSLPMPKGGKHANNPILCEDQPQPDQRPTRLGRMKNDPLNDDYIAGYSPFVTRDVYSKSAMLGIRSGKGGNFKYWMKKNPNESRGKRK